MSSLNTFATMRAHLVKTYAPPLLPPSKAHDAQITTKISDLQLHPTLEAALHILNLDLPSAHFLVRHMQAEPAFEGMYLHGILHRVEGDYDNARCWYSDVQKSGMYAKVWGSEGKNFKQIREDLGEGEAMDPYRKGGEQEDTLNAGQKFLNSIQAFKLSKTKDEGARKDLEQQSLGEFEAVLDWCAETFGTERMQDASAAWVKSSDENKEIGQKQMMGGEGHRKF